VDPRRLQLSLKLSFSEIGNKWVFMRWVVVNSGQIGEEQAIYVTEVTYPCSTDWARIAVEGNRFSSQQATALGTGPVAGSRRVGVEMKKCTAMAVRTS